MIIYRHCIGIALFPLRRQPCYTFLQQIVIETESLPRGDHPEVFVMNKMRKIIILSIVAIAVVVTFMMKERPEESIITPQEIPVLLDLSAET